MAKRLTVEDFDTLVATLTMCRAIKADQHMGWADYMNLPVTILVGDIYKLLEKKEKET